MIGRVTTIVIVGMAVNVYIPVSPSILGALVDYQGLDMDVAGRLISYNFWGGAAGSILAMVLSRQPRWNLRATMAACLTLVVLTSGASVWFAGDLPALAVVRFLNGIGAGLGFTVSCVAAICAPRVERTYALLYGSPYLISGAGLVLLPHVYRTLGIEGAFYGMGLLNLLCFALLPFFPKTVQQARTEPGPAGGEMEGGTRRLAALALGALLLHYVFNSGLWAYFERIGVAAGMEAEMAGAILGPGMGAAILGMIAASLLGDRQGYARPIYLGLGIIIAATVALLGSTSPWVFGFGTALFNASITFVTPYMVAILAILSPSGTGVVAANIATIIGFAAGPLLVSFLVGSGVFTAAILATAAGFIVVWVLYAWFVNSVGREARLARLKALCFIRRRPHAGGADSPA